MKIKIIDSPMGFGKTSYLIQKMNNDNSDNKYIYITPFLDEVDRIETSCKSRKFYKPTNKNSQGSKLKSLKNLVEKGKNIVSTHALFSMADNELITLIKMQGYILILDEVMDVVERVEKITRDDIDTMLKQNYIKIEEKPYNKIVWLDSKYNGRYNDIKNMALNDSLYYVSNILMVWSMPVMTFKAFKEIFISTYMFNCQIQKYYYDYFKLAYEYYHVIKNENNTYSIAPTLNNDYDIEFKLKAKELIEIVENTKLNVIGDTYGKNKNALCKNWYNENTLLLKKLKDNIYNFFFNYCKSKSEENMWTTFSNYRGNLKGKGYTKGFIPCNSRATNLYSHKKYLTYTINRYINPFYMNFFQQRNISINEDEFALSELVQWIWRSAIRKGEKIILYIPSERMRMLLIQWLNNEIVEF